MRLRSLIGQRSRSRQGSSRSMQFFQEADCREVVSRCGCREEERPRFCARRVTLPSPTVSERRGSTRSARLPVSSGRKGRCSFVPRVASTHFDVRRNCCAVGGSLYWCWQAPSRWGRRWCACRARLAKVEVRSSRSRLTLRWRAFALRRRSFRRATVGGGVHSEILQKRGRR